MTNVQFILDEAAMLGPMAPIDTAIQAGRGYAIRLTLFYQAHSQTRKCFPDGQEQTMLANMTQIYFATNDLATAQHISERIGDETIVVHSGGTSNGTTWQHSGGMHPSDSYGGSTTNNSNWSLQARRLLKPEEITTLPQRMAITFPQGMPPVCTWLLRDYEEKDLLKLATAGTPVKKRGILRALSLFVVMSFVSIRLTQAFFYAAEMTHTPAANRSVEYRIQENNDVTNR